MIATLKRRSEFLRLRGGRRWSCAAFAMETRPREQDAEGEPRFGFTVTKQLGKATVRNRIRRRLREAVRLVAAGGARRGHDYVLIARADAATRDFAELRRDVERAFAEIVRRNGEPGARSSAAGRRRGGAT